MEFSRFPNDEHYGSVSKHCRERKNRAENARCNTRCNVLASFFPMNGSQEKTCQVGCVHDANTFVRQCFTSMSWFWFRTVRW